jgi:hypothetical protein
LNEIQTSLKSFPPHSHPYSFALRFIFLQTHATSYSFYSKLLNTVKEKGGKPDRKPYPLPYGLRNPFKDKKYKGFEGAKRSLFECQCTPR